MGCAPSKIEQDEAVARCKERKNFMAEAVKARNAFAAAHSGYAVHLKSVGGGLSDYAHGEAPPAHAGAASSSAAMAPPPPVEKLHPPPPPLPDYSPSALQRSASMPDIPIPNDAGRPRQPVGATIHEVDDENDDNEIDHDDHGDEDEEDEDDDGEGHPDWHDAAHSASDTPPPAVHRGPAPATPPMPQPNGGISMDYIFGSVDGMPQSNYGHSEDDLTPPPGLWGRAVEPNPNPRQMKYPPSQPMSKSLNDGKPLAFPGKLERAKGVEPSELNMEAAKAAAAPRPQSVHHHQHAVSMSAADPYESRKGKMASSSAPVAGANLLKVVGELDDHFLQASESAHDVSKMLEAARMHYHSNFADSRGHIDHSARIMRAITWNRSFKGLPPQDDTVDNFDNDEPETHAMILDKMLAWEKKLYDEVKAGELMKIEYGKKVALLNKQKRRGVKPEVLEKTKAAVSHLHTRYIVDMQSMDSTVNEINRLRDRQLYSKLVELVIAMSTMWEAMYRHHRKQVEIITGVRSFEASISPRETSAAHRDRTGKLQAIVRDWHTEFVKLVTNQKKYIKSLNDWLKLNLIPIESTVREKVSSPPRQLDPPIKSLLQAWHDALEKLPVELAKTVIGSFADAIGSILQLQDEELALRKLIEDLQSDLRRKKRQFEEFHRKYVATRASMGETAGGSGDPDVPSAGVNPDPLEEKRNAVKELESRLTRQEENLRRLSRQVRDKSLASLKTHLPELFRALSEFSFESSYMYKRLVSVTQQVDHDEG